VDVDAGERAVELMRARVIATHGPEVLDGIGGFASAVSLPPGYRDPVLVSATDGVGTKTALAWAMRRFDTIGIDLVAMCADDVVCRGARPLFFLDYLAVGRVDPPVVAEIVGGMARGCQLAGCSLVGGETAEHPGLMAPEEFDLAGFCVGIAERGELFDELAAHAGDVLVGIASSGLHANGYSLVRAVVAEHRLDLGRPYLDVLRDHLGIADAEALADAEPTVAPVTLGEALLTPSRIYGPDILALRDELARAGTPLAGVAHVTGGGLPGNVPRVLAEGLAAAVRPGSWPEPSAVRLIAALGRLEGHEVRATLNAGIGMVAVVPRAGTERALGYLADRALRAWAIGEVVPVSATGGPRYLEVT
jgi:phosphoribosylformylglycinamidine cyclo-ligase